MGAYIRPEHLAFLEEAKSVFKENSRRETHQNEEGTLIALRFGQDRDCINIFELGEQVAFFAQQIEPRPNPRLAVLNFADDMETQLKANDHKKGWDHEQSEFLVSEIKNQVTSLITKLLREDRDKYKITKHCSNIANFAMMIADNEGEPL